MSLILSTSLALEANEIEKRYRGATDDYFDRFFRSRLSLSLVPRKAGRQYFFNKRSFEFQRDEVFGGAVENGIKANEESLARADADEDRRVETVWILPEMVNVAILFPAVLELE